LKLERDVGLAARVVGGKTGSHSTGHGETYWDKFKEIVAMGFIPVEVAKEIGAIPEEWSHPEESTLDKEVESGNFRLKK